MQLCVVGTAGSVLYREVSLFSLPFIERYNCSTTQKILVHSGPFLTTIANHIKDNNTTMS